MDFENLHFKRAMNVGIISFNRPDTQNAVNTATLKELDTLIDYIESHNEISVVVITGEGKAFVSGADIREMRMLNPDGARKFSRYAMDVFRKLELLEKPVIAAVNGYCLGGGCELMLCCDIRIASEKARIGHPEVGLGITPGFGGTQRLPRLIGISRAKEMIFAARIMDAHQAERIGLVNRVVAHEDLLDEALRLAGEISSRSIYAVKYAKSAINRGIETDIETGLTVEQDLFGLCFGAPDQREGMQAFLDKRAPVFAKEYSTEKETGK